MALPIRPELLRELRHRLGLRLHSLAEQAGISKDSVWRIENGMQPGNREDTQRRLARVLGVEPGVLTGELPMPALVETPRGRWAMEVSHAARNAAMLAARRYGVSETLILELAPLLFVIAAEESLGRRRAALAELEQALAKAAEAGKSMAHLPGVGEADAPVRAAIEAEEKSVSARDLFALALDPDVAEALGGAADPGQDNPFAVFLRERARMASIAAPMLASVVRVSPSDVWAAVCEDEARALADGDRILAESLLIGQISLADMPRGLWQDAGARVAWLREQLEIQDNTKKETNP